MARLASANDKPASEQTNPGGSGPAVPQQITEAFLTLLDQVGDAFEAEWRKGGRPRLEEYLVHATHSNRGEFLRELLIVELQCRCRRGESPVEEEYLERFPDQRDDIRAAFSAVRTSGLPSPPPAAAEIPGLLGDYEIVRPLGDGGMGMVYQARHRRLNRLVALKVIRPEWAGEQQALQRFAREMEAGGRLQHPNLVSFTDAREEHGVHFLVMEYVEGEDLGATLKRRGRLPVAEACEIIRQAACGLQHAYEQGLVHRDIKPSNLMLTAEHTVKILDLGLARLQSGGDACQGLTFTGQTMGTPDYMAPEQARGLAQIDIRADIYSLGCTLYHLLTGKPPYGPPQYAGFTAKILAHAQAAFPLAREMQPDIAADIDDVLAKMTAKDPNLRFATPAEVGEALLPYCQARLPAGDAVATRQFGDAPTRTVKATVEKILHRPWGCSISVQLCIMTVLLLSAAPLVWLLQSPRSPMAGGGTAVPRATHSPVPPAPGVLSAPNHSWPPSAAGVPALEIHYQAAQERGVWHRLDDRVALREDDRLQLHVHLDAPCYVYLYWYDADGKPQRLWPADAARQEPVRQVSSPLGEDQWHRVDDNSGIELALAAVRDDPLPAGDLADFESRSAYRRGSLHLEKIFPFTSRDAPATQRLDGVVQSPKDLLNHEFKQELQRRFASYQGIIIPHH